MPATASSWLPERDDATTEQLVRAGAWSVMLISSLIVVLLAVL